MRTTTVNTGVCEWTLGELNRKQGQVAVEETWKAFSDFPPPPAGEPDTCLQERINALAAVAWKTVLWCINNVQNWPTKDNLLGSDSEPVCQADLDASFTHATGAAKFAEMHTAALKLNDLFQEKSSGEPLADAIPSTGTLSASA